MSRALVLGGGGAKGAYEIGAWKAFNECGITFDIVVGTSIGALNGALIVQDDLKEAINLWSTINVDTILDQGIDFEIDFELLKEQAYRYQSFLKSLIYRRSLNVEPFIDLIKLYVDEPSMRNSAVKFGLCCVNLSKFKPTLLSIDEIDDGLLKEYLYASAACFPAFPLAEINKEKYIDGGYYDNLPIQLASRMGADSYYCVDLSSREISSHHLSFPNCHFIKLYHPISSFLNFQQEMSLKNIDYGYLDTMKVLGRYEGFAYTFTIDNHQYRNQLFSEVMAKYQIILEKLDYQINDATVYKYEAEFMNNYFHRCDDPTMNDMFVRVCELIGENFDFVYNYVYNFQQFNEMLDSSSDEYSKVYSEYKSKLMLNKRSFKEIYDILSGINKSLILVFIADLVDNIDDEMNGAILKAWMRIHYSEIIKAIYLSTLKNKPQGFIE